MAGSQDPNENPVAINVVPMVDVIFCLCVFFMCSFKFKQLEGKFESWLPRDKGDGGIPVGDVVPPEIRIAMFWDDANQKPVRKLGTRQVPEDDVLQKLIREQYADWLRKNRPDIPVTIDADARVPWKDVIVVMNLAKRENVQKIEFAFGGKH